MKTLKEILEKSILSGMDATLSNGDKYVININNEFDYIKSIFSDNDNWEKTIYKLPNNKKFIYYTCKSSKNCYEFIKFYFNMESSGLNIDVEDDNTQWNIKIATLYGKEILKVNKTAPKRTSKQTFNDFFKKYLLPKFKDIETFVDWIKEDIA
jgi:hypothetical protein